MYTGAWAQYYSLAYDVIIETLKNVTKGIELWPSSPSNGFQTTWSSPQDATRGDVHHYVYDGDCTDSRLYGEMPRFQVSCSATHPIARSVTPALQLLSLQVPGPWS